MILGYGANDSAGFERTRGIFHTTYIARFMLDVSLALLLITQGLPKRPNFRLGWFALFFLYVLAYISIFDIKYGAVASLKQIYSVTEWVVMVSLAAMILRLGENSSIDARLAALLRFSQLLPVVTSIIVLTMAPFNFRLAFLDGDFLRLGGAMIHPNKLSVLCALGVAAYMADPNLKRRSLPIVFLTAIVIWTGSRSGMAACALALFHGVLGRCPRRWLPFLYLMFTLCLLVIIMALLNYFSSHISSFLTNRQGGGLNNRDVVWAASTKMISMRPYFGFGWLEGPNQIGGFVNQSWWYARNAQNDFLNFGVAAGVPAMILILLIFLLDLIVGLSMEFKGSRRFLGIATIIILLSALVEPVMSTRFNSVGLIFAAVTILCGDIVARRGLRPKFWLTFSGSRSVSTRFAGRSNVPLRFGEGARSLDGITR
ncbi:hypothetical protein LK12_19225 [Novosphingobium malaysiense]|uniref:O-antigen ligase-related domain-containing protein n=1 Tax=Novosphingobium malaysiense TaxID=1348853 RepID=A0A0B1ZFZ4_9SPHN|nr:hypothetical protein LK12_19225 [Novosphingobium malaysiense]